MILLLTLIVAFLLMGLGLAAERAFFPQRAPDIARPIYALAAGWALCALAGAICALLGLGLVWPMTLTGAVGVSGLVIALTRADAAQAGLAALMVLPLLVVAANIPPTMFDEFTHWLPNTRYLVEHGHFASADAPNVWSVHPGYPPALPLIGYLVAQLAGYGYELAAKIFNVVVAAGFGLALAECIVDRVGCGTAIAIGVAAATVLNPFFDPRIALTTYADTASAFLLALCLIACWRSLDSGEPIWRWRIATVAIALVLLRETNVVLLAGLGCGVVLCGRRAWPTLASLAVPSFAVFLLWRGYFFLAMLPQALQPRAFAEWDWHAPITVLSILSTERLFGNPVLGLAALAMIGLSCGLLFWVMRSADNSLRRLFALTGVVTIVWIVFLAWSYIAVFSAGEVALAGSAWRYCAQLGSVLIFDLFATAGALGLKKSARNVRVGDHSPRWLFGAAILAALTPSLVTTAAWRYWKIDCRYPEILVARKVAEAFRSIVGEDGVITIVDARGAETFRDAVGYELHRPLGRVRVASSRGGAARDGYLLDFSGIDRARLLDGSPPSLVSLWRWEGDSWQLVTERKIEPADFACGL